MEQFKDSRGGLKEKLEYGREYYEIRLESIGGLGANLCGKMLGELGVKYLDLNSTSFSSYGSEKTGTPVKGYIRYCNKEKEIRVHSPVVEPDLLVVFHQALLKEKSVWKGCSRETAMIIALETGQEETGCLQDQENTIGRKNREKLSEIKLAGCKAGVFYGLEAQKIAMQTHSRINVVMFGAALKVMGLKDIEAGEQICKYTLGKKYPDSLKNNLEGIRRGYEEVKRLEIERRGEEVIYEKKEVCRQEGMQYPEWGYENAPIGGINTRPGSTVVADLSPSRQGYIPIFRKERCINCGLCHSTCPDMVFQFAKGEYKGKEMMVNQGLDYYHCKGCLRCVDVCPVNALVAGVEAEHSKKEYFMPNQELLRRPNDYEKAGADGYITSESYLTEKRMEGGEV